MIHPQAARDLANVWRRRVERLSGRLGSVEQVAKQVAEQCAEELDGLADLAERRDKVNPVE